MRSLLLPLCIVLATAAHAEDLNKVAEGHEAEFRKAIMAGNIGWFEKMASADYFEIDAAGKRSPRAEVMAQMKGMFSMAKFKSVTTKILKVTPTKNGMVVSVDCQMVATMLAPGTKKPSLMATKFRFDETWSKDAKGWKIRSLKTRSQKTTIDGKPLPNGM